MFDLRKKKLKKIAPPLASFTASPRHLPNSPIHLNPKLLKQCICEKKRDRAVCEYNARLDLCIIMFIPIRQRRRRCARVIAHSEGRDKRPNNRTS